MAPRPMATSGLVILLPMRGAQRDPCALFRAPASAVVSSGSADATPRVTTPISEPPTPVADDTLDHAQDC